MATNCIAIYTGLLVKMRRTTSLVREFHARRLTRSRVAKISDVHCHVLGMYMYMCTANYTTSEAHGTHGIPSLYDE